MNWHEYFYYDESSPSCLRWKVKRKSANPHDVAGCINGSGYYIVGCCSKIHLVHRIIWELHNDPLQYKYKIDHIDRDRSNNILNNLRLTSTSQNAMNKNISISNKSGYKGMCWRIKRQLWRSSIEIRCNNIRKHIHLGYYTTAEDAARAYDAKAIELFGEFALTNKMLGLLE